MGWREERLHAFVREQRGMVEQRSHRVRHSGDQTMKKKKKEKGKAQKKENWHDEKITETPTRLRQTFLAPFASKSLNILDETPLAADDIDKLIQKTEEKKIQENCRSHQETSHRKRSRSSQHKNKSPLSPLSYHKHKVRVMPFSEAFYFLKFFIYSIFFFGKKHLKAQSGNLSLVPTEHGSYLSFSF